MGLAIGVDVGGTKILAGLVDEDGRLSTTTRRPTPSTDPEAVADTIADVVDELRKSLDDSSDAVDTVGIGAAGFVDRERSTLLFAPNLAWRDEPLRDKVSKRIDLPVVVENDANATAWGEFRFGAGRDADAQADQGTEADRDAQAGAHAEADAQAGSGAGPAGRTGWPGWWHRSGRRQRERSATRPTGTGRLTDSRSATLPTDGRGPSPPSRRPGRRPQWRPPSRRPRCPPRPDRRSCRPCPT